MLADFARHGLDVKAPVFSKQRIEELSYPNGFLFKANRFGNIPLIIHEVGGPDKKGQILGNHTSPKALALLPQEMQSRILVNHNSRALPEEARFHQALPLTTYAIISKGFILWEPEKKGDIQNIPEDTFLDRIFANHAIENIEDLYRTAKDSLEAFDGSFSNLEIDHINIESISTQTACF